MSNPVVEVLSLAVVNTSTQYISLLFLLLPIERAKKDPKRVFFTVNLSTAHSRKLLTLFFSQMTDNQIKT